MISRPPAPLDRARPVSVVLFLQHVSRPSTINCYHVAFAGEPSASTIPAQGSSRPVISGFGAVLYGLLLAGPRLYWHIRRFHERGQDSQINETGPRRPVNFPDSRQFWPCHSERSRMKTTRAGVRFGDITPVKRSPRPSDFVRSRNQVSTFMS
jgi:hypothetical protein